MSSTEQQFCTFFIERLLFGVEVEKVQEVIRHQGMTRVPLATELVGGLINLRGQIVTAVNLRRRLGLKDSPPGQLPMNVVVRTGAHPGSLQTEGQIVAGPRYRQSGECERTPIR